MREAAVTELAGDDSALPASPTLKYVRMSVVPSFLTSSVCCPSGSGPESNSGNMNTVGEPWSSIVAFTTGAAPSRVYATLSELRASGLWYV